MGNGQPSSANVLSGVTGAFVGRCGRAVYARFIGPQPTLLDMPSPSARPSIFPFEGGTIEFEVNSGLADPFSTPAVCIAAIGPLSVTLPSLFPSLWDGDTDFQGRASGLSGRPVWA